MKEAHIRSRKVRGLPGAVLAVAFGLGSGCMDLTGGQQPDAARPVTETDPYAAARLLSPLIQRTVSEGDTVTLRTGVPMAELQAASYVWIQTSGPPVELNDVVAPTPTFVAPQVDSDTLLVFQFVLTLDGTTAVQHAVVHVRDIAPPAAEPPCGAAGCGPGTRCNPVAGVCEAVSPCEEITCGPDRTCDEATGACIRAEVCGDVVCGPDERCDPDMVVCEPLCPDVTCQEDEQLDPDTCTCEPLDPCLNVTCPDGEQCNTETGQCESNDLCADVTCDTGETCDPLTGECTADDLCSDVMCPSGSDCDPDTGECVEDPCSEPAAGSVFVVADTSVGSTQFTMIPDYWIEFDQAVDPATFEPGDVEVAQAGPDNQWGTSDDVVVSSTAQHDGSRRISVSLAPGGGELLAGRWYRVSLSPGCLRATGSGGEKLGLDGEFNGSFPSGNGQYGGMFVQEFIGVAPGAYTGDLVCDEETRDILGRVDREEKHYDDTIVVDPTGVLMLGGKPIRVGEELSPEFPGFEFVLTAEEVTPLSDRIHIVYDVVGTMDQYRFDGPQDESYTFLPDGTILHAGTSDFRVRTSRGAVVAEFTRTCNGILRR